MSAAAVRPLLDDPALLAWVRVAQTVAETHELGARFHIVGAGITVRGAANLPQRLRDEITELAEDDLLRRFLLSGKDPDQKAIVFLRDVLQVEAVLVDTRDGVRHAVVRLERDLAEHGGYFGLDIETFPQPGQGEPRPAVRLNRDGTPAEKQPKWENRAGLDPHRAEIGCLQLYGGGKTAFAFRGPALVGVLGLRWLRRQDLVVHNATFETSFLLHHAGRTHRLQTGGHPIKRGRYDCTQQSVGLVFGAGFGGSGRSLETAAAKVLDLAVPKELQVSDWSAAELSKGQIAYAAGDAVIAYRLWPPLKAAMQQRPPRQTWSLWDAYELQRRAIPAVADMQLRGLGFDRDEHARQVEAWAVALAEARHRFKETTGSAPPVSNKDKEIWLRDVLDERPEHFAEWPRTPTGQLSLRAGHLKRLVFVETVKALIAIQANEKLLSGFGAKLVEKISPVTGRLHGSYNIAAAKSGRFSASNPNLQQLPRRRAVDFPRCIVAAPGHVLVACDLSQVEMRAAAWMYQDRALTRIFAEGRDIHNETAAAINGCPVDAVSSVQRDGAKAINYGAIFGQGPRGLRENAFVTYGVELSLAEAERACDRFKRTYRDLYQGLWDNYHRCVKQGYIVIGAGRIIKAEWEVDVGQRLIFPRCCNAPIQGICADLLLRAIAWLYGRLKQRRILGGLVAAVHDELVCEVAEDDAEKTLELLENTLLEAFVETFPGAATNGVATAKIGNTWGDAKQ